MSSLVFSQENNTKAFDSIFTHQKTIVCKVIEVGSEDIKFSYPNETLSNSINKNRIVKIKFSSGREEVFVERASFNEVNGWEDWGKVSVTHINNEVEGLYRINDVSSKVKGGSTLSNMNKLKNKALRKIKIRAAMNGANMIYLIDNHTESAKHNVWTGGSSTAEVLLTGVAYSNKIPTENDLKSVLENEYQLIQIIKMPFNKKTPTIVKGSHEVVELKNYTKEGIFMFIRFNDEQYRIANILEDSIVLLKEGKRRTFNYLFKKM